MKIIITILFSIFIFILGGYQSKLDDNVRSSQIVDERYEVGNLDILIELNVISKEDLSKDTFISNLEVLQILHKINAYDDYTDLEEARDLKEWYRGDTLKPLDYLDGTYKSLILDLLYSTNSSNYTITSDDILNMKFDENITNYEALTYITRMLGNTYGCTDYPEEFILTQRNK